MHLLWEITIRSSQNFDISFLTASKNPSQEAHFHSQSHKMTFTEPNLPYSVVEWIITSRDDRMHL